MPHKPKRPCSYPGCPALTSGRFCERHKQEVERSYNRERGSSTKQGYGARWRKARETFLNANPLCAACQLEGRVTMASTVDHIVPHKGDPALFWDQGNWQSLCHACHSRKTAKEDGRWGSRGERKE